MLATFTKGLLSVRRTKQRVITLSQINLSQIVENVINAANVTNKILTICEQNDINNTDKDTSAANTEKSDENAIDKDVPTIDEHGDSNNNLK